MMIVLIWIVLAAVVGWAAGQKGRSGIGFFFLSVLVSPLIGLLVLIAVPARPTAPAIQVASVADRPGGAKPARRGSLAPYLLGGAGLVILLFVLAGREKDQPRPSSSASASVATSSPVPSSSPSANPAFDASRAAAAGPAPNRPLTAAEIREAQTLLSGQGLEAGTPDGVVGPTTTAAVKRYEERRGWSITGAMDLRLLEYLRAGKGGTVTSTQPPTPPAAPSSPSALSATSADLALASRVIREADHPCPIVLAAVRLSDDSLRASCSNGEIYRIMNLGGKWLAMRCSAAQRMRVQGC